MWPFRQRQNRMVEELEELRRNRIVTLEGEITDEIATVVIAKLLFLEDDDALRPITLRIASPGGDFAAGMAVIDTMRSLKPPIRTEARTLAHGMALAILASGTKGTRVIGANAQYSLGAVTSRDESMPWRT